MLKVTEMNILDKRSKRMAVLFVIRYGIWQNDHRDWTSWMLRVAVRLVL